MRQIVPQKLAQIQLDRSFLSKACFWPETITIPGTSDCSGSEKGKLCGSALLRIKWWISPFAIECRILSALGTLPGFMYWLCCYQPQACFRAFLLSISEAKKGLAPFNPGLTSGSGKVRNRKSGAICYIIVGETLWWFLNISSAWRSLGWSEI